MTAQKVLEIVAKMPYEDWVTIQNGIADMMVAEMSSEEIEEIRLALEESERQIERGEVFTPDEVRKKLGLT
jgi:predicted transcriptional regulator